MTPLVVCLLIVLICWLALLLVALLATAVVVGRLARYARDDAWTRITDQHRSLRRREQFLAHHREEAS